MKSFGDISLSHKIIGAFAGVSLIIVFLSITLIYNLFNVSKNYEALQDYNGATSGSVAKMGTSLNAVRVEFLNMMLQKDPNEAQKHLAKIQELDTKIMTNYNVFWDNARTEQGRQELRTFRENWDKYKAARQASLDLILANQPDQAWLLFSQNNGGAIAATMNAQLDKLYDMSDAVGDKATADLSAQTRSMIYTMILIAIVVIIISSITGAYISRYIKKNIEFLIDGADKIAAGDLTVSIRIENNDEFGHLADAFDRMSQNVNAAMSNINAASEQVAAGSKNVSESSISLSQGATEQASSVEELSSSLEEVSAQTKLNAQSANKANELTSKAQSEASVGNDYMKEMLESMKEINTSSTGISKIIKVIDEIAFQTNILALNAAVEAARAGQHGKGFAVVAEEVRNLAARSAKAAKETTDMIEGSIGKVNDGTKIANETAQALNKIVETVTEVAELVEKIAGASTEQSIALEQINQGVIQVSDVVQSNSATAEESAAASEELSAQAELLKETVAQFRLRQETSQVMNNIPYQGKKEIKEMKNKNKDSGKAKKIPTQIALSDDEFGKY